ncbi:MAG: hemolysin family protein [Micrococcales bacterium]
MTDWILLAVGVVLTIGTGFFVASEFSLVNLERNELEARASRGEKGLGNTIRALKRTSTHLSGAQLGITLTTMLTGFIAEPAVSNLIRPALTPLGLSPEAQTGTAVTLTMILATIFSTLFGELIPKKLALTIPLALNRFVVIFQLGFTWLFGPMIWALNKIGDKVVRGLGIEPREELSSSRTAEELASLVRRSATLGALDQQTATLITKTLQLRQLVAADIMTPRPRMFVIDRDESVQAVIALCNQTGHSRFPVIDGSTDDVVGFVHVKQAASVPRAKRNEVPVSAITVPAERVPETMPLESLMGLLRSKGLQMAIVVDEYGGTAGLATLEDLIEELVGELADEHDRTRVGVRRGQGNSVLFPGMMRPDELKELAIYIPEDGAYETVGGYLMSSLGKIPVVGDQIDIDGGVLRVERMDGRRVDRVRFTPVDLLDQGGAANA